MVTVQLGSVMLDVKYNGKKKEMIFASHNFKKGKLDEEESEMTSVTAIIM